jgi:cytochrome c peroxidase
MLVAGVLQMSGRWRVASALAIVNLTLIVTLKSQSAYSIGSELAVPRHLQDGEEFRTPLHDLIAHGQKLFTASWTVQEGAGRPLTKGTGNPLTDQSNPLLFPRAFNRISAPDSNSCAGCHNLPIPGGGGDIVANVFVLGQRFDFASFDGNETLITGGAVDESGVSVTLQSIANSRATLGMFGSGYIEMLARQMTTDLQTIRDGTLPGTSRTLVTKGISFGRIGRSLDGRWDLSQVEGLVAPSLQTAGPGNPPSLIVRPFHQASNVISLRQFSNNAFNHHHGIQSTERFGVGTDADGDGFVNELTRADVTAVSVFQAVMAVPGRVIPNDPDIEAAVLIGEARFQQVGCSSCHVPSLPLDREGWVFTEPNPFNPTGNLQPGQSEVFAVDLTRNDLPQPRLRPVAGVVYVPAFTDLKVHNICAGPDDPNGERLDMNQPAGSPAFFRGNQRFITRKLWGVANEPPFFHHGQFTTLREAVLAHAGEALASRQAFRSLPAYEQDAVIEFLKTLQVLPPGTPHLVVDEHGKRKTWPPRR